jgi:hypothetical protein
VGSVSFTSPSDGSSFTSMLISTAAAAAAQVAEEMDEEEIQLAVSAETRCKLFCLLQLGQI